MRSSRQQQRHALGTKIGNVAVAASLLLYAVVWRTLTLHDVPGAIEMQNGTMAIEYVVEGATIRGMKEKRNASLASQIKIVDNDNCHPIQEFAECTLQAKDFGPLSYYQCAHKVASDIDCGSTFMYSSNFPDWGCRCCVSGDSILSGNANWALYSASECMAGEQLEAKVARLHRDTARLKEENLRLKKLIPYTSVSEEIVSELYGVLREVIETLHKEGSKLVYPWFVTGGTLIGALRSNPPGMTRWDDDLDLGVKKDGLEEIHKILKANPRLKWKKHGQFLAYKYFLENGTKFGVDEYGVDFFAYDNVNSSWHLMTSDGESIETNFDHEYWKDKELILGVYPCPFWDFMVNCPIASHEFLMRTYGDKIMLESSVWNHKQTEPRPIHLETENLNQHGAYFPAMTRELMGKLKFVSEEN